MSRRVSMALIAVGILAVGLAVFLLLINPIRGDISELQSKIDEEQQKISSAKIQLAAAETTRSEGRRNQARLLELAKMIPSSLEIPSLILQLQDLADKAGIEFIQISPSEVREEEGLSYQMVPLALSFSGSFYDVSDFIYRAEQMASGPGRLLTVKDIALTPDTIKGGALSVNMTIYAFVMGATVSEPPAAPATSDGSESTSTTVSTQ